MNGSAFLRRLLVGGLLTVLSVLSTAGLASAQTWSYAPTALPGASAGQQSAIDQLGGCLAAQHEGDMLLLVDESGSLRTTDPDNVRVTAASTLLSRLAEVTASTGTRLDVAVSGFDVDYHPAVRWQQLTMSSLPGITSGVGAFAARDTGLDTDYVSAMQGARNDLRSRQHGSERPRCQAVLWLSDGAFDIESRTPAMAQRYGDTKPYAPGVQLTSGSGTETARRLGRQALCRTGGVMDQIRSTGALTFAVGLGPSGDNFDLMRSMADGEGCGATPTAVVGDFLLAKDVDGMVFALDRLSTPGVTPLERETDICPAARCTHSFVLDASIRAVHLLAGSTAAGVDVVLRDPSSAHGVRFHWVPGKGARQVTVAGQRVTATWLTNRTLQLDLKKAASDGWSGQWGLQFVEPKGGSGARARSQLTITGDLLPAVTAEPELRSGAIATLHLGLSSEATKRSVNVGDVLGHARLSATLVPATGAPVTVVDDIDPKTAGNGTKVDLGGVSPGAATLRLTLAVTTRGVPRGVGRAAVSGTRLADRQVDLVIPVLPPLHFPTPGVGRVDFGRLEGTGPVATTLPVAGPGCVWLVGQTVQGEPDGVGRTLVTSPAGSRQTCLRLAVGQRGSLQLSLKADAPGDGVASGLLAIGLAPDADNAAPVTTSVRYAADLVKPADAAVRAMTFVVALALGIGLPLALLYFAKWWSARMPGRPLQVGRFRVGVRSGQVERAGAPFAFALTDLQYQAVPQGGARQLQVLDATLRTRAGFAPTVGGSTRMTVPDSVVVSPHHAGHLPLALQGTWAAAVGPTGEITLYVFLPSLGATQALVDRLCADVRDRLPDLVARVPHDAGPGPRPAAAAQGAAGPGSPSVPAARGWGGESSESAAPPGPSGSGWGDPHR